MMDEIHSDVEKFVGFKTKFDSLNERDKQTYVLAQRAVNALGFALQNTHSERIMEKYEERSGDAMRALFEHLCT